MKFMRHSKQKHSQRGTTLVELALAFPLLITIVMSTYQVGLVISKFQSLNRVCYEIARIAATDRQIGTTFVPVPGQYILSLNNHVNTLPASFKQQAQQIVQHQGMDNQDFLFSLTHSHAAGQLGPDIDGPLVLTLSVPAPSEMIFKLLSLDRLQVTAVVPRLYPKI